MVRILVDTDIGDDIDDVYCLSYLLAQPEAEIVGITTVGGAAARRAALADAVCRAAGRGDVPIVPGSERTLGMEALDVPHPQTDVVAQFAHRPAEELGPSRAVELIVETILAAPGEVTLLGIGPLTNIALACASRPDVLAQARGIVLMNGVYKSDDEGSEWNSRCDPVATWVTFRSGLPITAVGLDVTSRCTISVAEERERLGGLGGPFEVASAALEVWERESDVVTFHDPLAAAVLFEPGLCRYEEGTVTPDLLRLDRMPMTRWSAHSNGAHRVAVDVDSAAFFADFERVTRASFGS